MKIPEYYDPISAPIGLAIFGLAVFGKDYQPFMIGLEARKQVGHIRTFRVRHGNGEAGSVLGQKYQDEMIYYTPTNPQTAHQQLWRTVLRAGVWKWSKMTAEEKEPWITEAKKHRNWSAYNTFISAWLKYLWKEEPMRVPDYDSLWLSYAQGEEKTLTHDLKGNPDDYLIKLEAKNPTSGIHNIGVGSRFIAGTIRGFVYGGVTADIIKVKRYVADTTAPQIRVKIWRYA